MDFDLLGFSNSIIQELVNLPALLSHSGIPLKKSQRLERSDVPLVILGGANALYTSVFWNQDSVVDGIFVGESEDQVGILLDMASAAKAAGLNKSETLARLEKVPGFIQPDSSRVTAKFHDVALSKSVNEPTSIVPFEEGCAGEGHLQISEGCPCFCTFCAESFGRKPYRELSVETLVEQALAMKREMGLEAIELYSFNFNMHSGIRRLLWELAPLLGSLRLKSQRLDFIARDPDFLSWLQVVEKSSLTCGVEGISKRLRQYLGKGLSEEDLHRALQVLLRSPLRELKIFLIVTGLETEPDIRELGALAQWMDRTLKTAGRKPRIIFSVTPLVRFPATPLEFSDACSVETMRAVLEEVETVLAPYPFECRRAAEPDEYWLSQVLLRASDSRVGQALMLALSSTGFLYYRSVPESFTRTFRHQLGLLGLEPNDLLRAPNGPGPWARVETGLKREFLKSQHQLAVSFAERESCLGREGEAGKCMKCGACRTAAERQRVTAARRREVVGTADEFRQRVERSRRDVQVIPFRVELTPFCRGLERTLVASVLARAFMRTSPELCRSYLGFRGSFWSHGGRGNWICGVDQVDLGWRGEGIDRLHRALADDSCMRQINQFFSPYGELKGVGKLSMADILVRMDSPFEFAGQSYFESHALRYSLRKLADGTYAYEFSKDSLKKKILRALTVVQSDAGCVASLVPDEKFDAHEFASSAFCLADPRDWVKVMVTSRARSSDNSTGS